MKIVIIGTGNMANFLGKKFKNAGHEIAQIVGRNAEAASNLAYELNSESTNYYSVLNQDADAYIICVSDAAIQQVTSHLQLNNKIVAHTAGAVSMKVLEGISSNYGVVYPLQTIKGNRSENCEVPFFIDGSNNFTKTTLQTLVQSITTHPVSETSDSDRLQLHIAAVWVNNFVNHLYALAEHYCKKQNIDFSKLHPIIKETALKVEKESPLTLQTGPAVRQDAQTIKAHLEQLENFPEMHSLYQQMVSSIQAFHAKF